jgi:outer membrane receptor protein involved in Fe transport
VCFKLNSMRIQLRIITLLIAFTTLGWSATAQSNTFTIKANVLDGEDKPVEFGNVLALSLTDSSLLQGTLFMDGILLFERVATNSFLLKLTSLGYDDVFIPITRANESEVDLGTVKMLVNAKLMNEFQVVATVPVFERKGDRIIVNVSETDMSSAGTASDVLRRSPSVVTDANDNVSIFGKGEAIIYLDGQRVNASEVLASIPSSEIEKIEVIKNPSAKYDAEGQGVINIITKKNNLEGYNVVTNQNFTRGKHLYYTPNLYITVKKKKLLVDLSLSGHIGKMENESDYERDFISDTSLINMDNYVNAIDNKKPSLNSRLGIFYNLNSRNKVAVQLKSSVTDSENNQNNSSRLHTENNVLSTINTATFSDREFRSYALSANHTYSDTNGLHWFTAAEQSQFVTDSRQAINESIWSGASINENTKRSLGHNDISITTAQSDFSKMWNNSRFSIESVIKFTSITNDSKLNFDVLNEDDNTWFANPALSNGFNFEESISAGYLQLVKKVKKYDLRVGVRGEYTDSYGFSNTLDTEVIDTTYFNIFPSAYLSYQFNDEMNLGVTYSNRLKRAAFSDLEPFVDYLDSLSAFVGNPYLKPEFSQSIEASFIYLEASLDVGYTSTKDAMFTVVDKADDGTNSFIAQTQNIESADVFSIGLNIPYEIKWWTTSNSVGWAHSTYSFLDESQLRTLSKPNWFV